jgi:hypothetical protein
VARVFKTSILAALAAALITAATAAAQATGGIPVPAAPTPIATPQEAPAGSAFDGNGQWIWQLGRSNGGNLDSIAARARAAGITTVFVKSSDGTGYWGQFSPALVAGLHARGLRACAWQYVYGRNPRAEARLGRAAILDGADCLVIDAESEYQGRYAAASVYIGKLRAYAGADYPIGLAGFPYVDYHPGFPYSVFLGPRGAQFNVPQMYWHAIGTSVDQVYSHTYLWNSLYARPIYPLGQLYENPPKSDIVRFRQLAQAYGARGVSWWSWQSASKSGWSALAAPLAAVPATAEPAPALAPTLKRGARGDSVVWAQQHLMSAGQKVSLSGIYDKRTGRAVKAFQTANAMSASGVLDAATWRVLLAHPPAKVRWRTGGGASAARAGTAPEPRSARLPAVRDELRSSR